ncbi:hypothetical protein PBLACG01_0035400 [Plasmodium sp.]|nr:hypothetical protein PBLACG01_0035400 [Plasmodium sp.]
MEIIIFLPYMKNTYNYSNKICVEQNGSIYNPPNNIATQQNINFHTKNICTYISMDIYFDENNIYMDENNNNVPTNNVPHNDNI